MLFNTLDFAIFLPVVLIVYWAFKRSIKIQNIILLIASYFFYAWWDWRFLGLILLSTLADYFIGGALGKATKQFNRQLLLWGSLIVNLGILGFFKYFNFFIENFKEGFSIFGTQLPDYTIDILLPVGISFYTFQTLSYTIDVYRDQIEPARNLIDFAVYVSFFPQLVAGPIERAVNLLPQFRNERNIDEKDISEGLRQILWGLFKKMVIADNCAEYVNIVFDDPAGQSGSVLLLGVIFFAFQIYGDFSGYSDVAIGTARLFGFRLMQNFAFPYFSRDIAEFWRRWHISLSTWFRDYVYVPLGGSRGTTANQVRNVFIIFIVSGLWHGANWTFIIWGGLNAFFFLPILLRNRNRKHIQIVARGQIIPNLREFGQIILTFTITCFAWIFFRASSLTQALNYIKYILTKGIFQLPHLDTLMSTKMLILLIFVMLIVEWFGRDGTHALESMENRFPAILRWSFYSFLIFGIGMYMYTEETPFIYFQF